MRTIRVTLVTGGGLFTGGSVELSTEMIVDDHGDTLAEHEGAEAMRVLLAISRGMASVAVDEED